MLLPLQRWWTQIQALFMRSFQTSSWRMLHRVVTLTLLTAQADGATPVWNLPSCLVAISKGYPYAQKAFEPIISKADKG
jgi:hypothetical protein